MWRRRSIPSAAFTERTAASKAITAATTLAPAPIHATVIPHSARGQERAPGFVVASVGKESRSDGGALACSRGARIGGKCHYVDMDIDAAFDCPECGATVKATLSDWAASATKVCRNGHSIRLEGKGAKEAKKSLDELNKTLKNFGKR